MLRRRDPRLLHRAADRSDAALLGGDDVLYRRAAAGRRGVVQGGVPGRGDGARRDCRGRARTEPRQRARTPVARPRAVARPVPLHLAARPDAARLCVPARGLYRQHHRLSIGRGAGRGLHHRCAAGAGDHDRYPVRQSDPRPRLPADRHRRAARPDRRDPRRCGTLVARFACGGKRCRARPRPAAAGTGHQRAAPAFHPSAVRHRTAAPARPDVARTPGGAVDAVAAGERDRRPDRRTQAGLRQAAPRGACADRGRSRMAARSLFGIGARRARR